MAACALGLGLGGVPVVKPPRGRGLACGGRDVQLLGRPCLLGLFLHEDNLANFGLPDFNGDLLRIANRLDCHRSLHGSVVRGGRSLCVKQERNGAKRQRKRKHRSHIRSILLVVRVQG